ncbi:hypothetical protein ACHAW6_006802, partial [Cyclotella cf. meneghiniana]
HSAPEIVNVSWQTKAVRVAKIATKRQAVPPTKQCPLFNKPRAASPTANSQKAKPSKRDKIARKCFNNSSLQCSLMGDELCEELNSDSTKMSCHRESMTSNSHTSISSDPEATTKTHYHPSETTYRVMVSSNPTNLCSTTAKFDVGEFERTYTLETSNVPKAPKEAHAASANKSLKDSANHRVIESDRFGRCSKDAFLASVSRAITCQNATSCHQSFEVPCLMTTPKISQPQICHFEGRKEHTNDDVHAFVSFPRASISNHSSHARPLTFSPKDTTNVDNLYMDHISQDDETEHRVIKSSSKSNPILDTCAKEHPNFGPEQVKDTLTMNGGTTERPPTNNCIKISDTKEWLNEQDNDLEGTHLRCSPEHARDELSKSQELTGDRLSHVIKNASEYEKRLIEIHVQLREIRALLESDTVQWAMKTHPHDIPKAVEFAFVDTAYSCEAVCSQRTQDSIDSAVLASHLSGSSRCDRVNTSGILGQCDCSHMSFSPNSSFDLDDGSFLNEPVKRQIRKQAQLLYPRRHVKDTSDVNK